MSAIEFVSAGQARRIALAAQGFDRPRPRRAAGHRELGRTIRELGLLQLDFVKALVPAHMQVPFSRLGPYDPAQLHGLIYHRREFTETWAHEASIVPVETWPLLRYRTDLLTFTSLTCDGRYSLTDLGLFNVETEEKMPVVY